MNQIKNMSSEQYENRNYTSLLIGTAIQSKQSLINISKVINSDIRNPENACIFTKKQFKNKFRYFMCINID